MTATLAERQQVGRASAEVRRMYQDAVNRVAAKVAGEGLLFGVSTWFLSTGSEEAAERNLRELGPQIDRWDTMRKGWALEGLRPDGSPYTVAAWLSEGKAYAEAAALHAGVSFDSSVFGILAGTASGTVKDIGDGVQKVAAAVKPSSATTVLLVAGVAVLVLWVARPYFAAAVKAAA